MVEPATVTHGERSLAAPDFFNQAHLSLGGFRGWRRARRQLTLQHRAALKPEAPDPNPESCVWEFLRNVWWYSWEFPNRRFPRSSEVSRPAGGSLSWSSSRLRARLQGGEPSTGHSDGHFSENRICGNAPFWLFFYTLSAWSEGAKEIASNSL